ncbi:MAG TPA: xanthine dehydrogenase family protein molybdopterin-binding subunit [Conexibacter sp.]|nr:xanthine dehydrogenase family protein molybdopterin-binding subunit [Conexibacter sp.]
MSDERVIGRPLPRAEDPRLLRGEGCFTADLLPAGTLHMAVVRSPLAHGELRAIDAAPALALDGVRAVWTAADLAERGVRELPICWISAGQKQRSTPLLARERVHYVGQPLAVVVAEDPYLAEDAAELVALELEPLPVVTGVEQALAPDAPLLHPAWGDNTFAVHRAGSGDPDAAFAADDAVIVRGRFHVHRHAGMPMEGRAALAVHDPREQRTTAWLTCQVPHHTRTVLCEVLGWEEPRLRVIPPDVGGAFGVKEFPYPEDAIVCLLAAELGRPVRWVEDRREHFLSAVHAREQTWEAELAADPDGRVRAVRGRILYDAGGHPSSQGIGVARVGADMMLGPYDVRHYRMEIVGVATNKVPAGAYRGFGRPQATFVLERLLDLLAKRLGADPVELRRRNLIASEQQPYANAAGHVYDGGDYPAAYARALELAGWAGFRAAQAAARAEGRLLGFACCPFVMAAGLASSRVLGAIGLAHGGYETVQLRMDPTGKLTVLCGSASQGQGHATVLAQAAADRLGLDPARDVVVRLGDTAATPYASASAIASRVGSVAGGAVVLAADALGEKLRRIAAHALEASEGDVELRDGRAQVRGSAAAGLSLAEVAHIAHLGHDLPEGVAPGLELGETFEPPGSSYPYATHAAVVEVEPATGAVRILRYVVVHDSGTLLNPAIVEGQIRGAVAQAIGGALLEQLVYDDGGQLVTTSFMDYLLPTAADVPPIEVELRATPAPGIPGGMKGVGEAGTVAPAALLANAVLDALGDPALEVSALPLTPERVWALARGISP